MATRPGPRDQARESARARRATEAELFKELEVFLILLLPFCPINSTRPSSSRGFADLF